MSNPPGDKFSVPDSFLGQIYQIWYALLLLVESGFEDANAAVSVELVDDVAVHSGGAVKRAVQTKRTTTDLSDTSVPLWKTIRIWSEHVKSGVIDLDHARAIPCLDFGGAPRQRCEHAAAGGAQGGGRAQTA